MKTRVLIPAFAACLAFTAAHAVEFQRWKTADGVTITLVERHELPIVNMQITFKGAGRVAEHKPDLAAFTATMLPSGTEKYGEEAPPSALPRSAAAKTFQTASNWPIRLSPVRNSIPPSSTAPKGRH